METKLCESQKRDRDMGQFREWRKWHPEEVARWARENPKEYEELGADYKVRD